MPAHEDDSVSKEKVMALRGPQWPDAPAEAPETCARLPHAVMEYGRRDAPEGVSRRKYAKRPLGIYVIDEERLVKTAELKKVRHRH